MAMKFWHDLRRHIESHLSSLALFHKTDCDQERLLPAPATYGTSLAGPWNSNQTKLQNSRQRSWFSIERLRLLLVHTWLSKTAYLRQFGVLIPYIYPSSDWKTQMSMLTMVLVFFKDRTLQVFIPRQVGMIVDSIHSESINEWETIIKVCSWMSLKVLLDFSLPEEAAAIRVSQGAMKKIAGSFHAHILNLSADFFRSERSTDLIGALNDGQDVSFMIEDMILRLAPVVIDLVVAMIYLYYTINGCVTLAIFLSSGTYMILGHYGTCWLSEPNRSYLEKRRQYQHELQESIQNRQTIVYFRRQDSESRRFLETLTEFFRREGIYFIGYICVSNAQEVFLNMALFGAAFATILGTKKEAEASSFIVLVTYWIGISKNLKGLTKSLRDSGQKLVATEKLANVFDAKPTVISGDSQLVTRAGDVSFKDVCFTYPGLTDGLDNITFEVPGGSTVGIVGESGGGKSALVNLLLRQDDPTSGTIRIDGQDIRDVTLASLRETVGIVSQDSFIFDRSILENVRFGRLDASDEEVREVCKVVGLHDSIMKFGEGYETKAGERGKRLSGGQKQRIAMARVLLRRPKVMILDEPTSAVDSITEARMMNAVDNVNSNGPPTKIVITHRLSTIKKADLIIVLRKGRIEEMGTHSELIEKEGMYHAHWSSQLQSVVV
ncbi:hypothetical protein PV08_11843 [Exophiala spinifera]|uniref:ABC transporter domain-containing protein n=1 Tax=Exophiala spinifera TaxID=91928 RepID=A0A0D1ZAN4_9EURO|nr:uncharacterized protein PV08_11843 [Exophiala spinifera]KIW10067.1 hypothetical protein PV08_11843 [Exophiala spinifera]